MFNLSSLSIAKRLTVLVVSAILGIIILAALFLVSERKLIMEERQAAVRQTVETAHGVVSFYHAAATAGKMTEDEAKLQAMAALKGLRYSSNEYFWIND
ncbi:MAG: cache domain-containing protein, partial [Pseudomonadota bacterium]